jgi:phosphate starvation-inducible PhoH-like protein
MAIWNKSLHYAPDSIAVTAKGRPIKSKTFGQRQYVQAIRDHEVTFAIGPAGTGKTFLAVAMAVNAFRSHDVSRIILTRPAVEAGEEAGLSARRPAEHKVDPYMRPLYDALHELMGR